MGRNGWLIAFLVFCSSAAPAQTATDSYVDAAVCASGHPKQAATYRLTGMGRYRDASRLRPGFALANLSLGWALAQSGKPEEGIPYLNAAAGSAEVAVGEKAQSLLNQYSPL